MLDLLGHILVDFLKFSRSYILLYSLPTNPISTIFYLSFAYYGYSKLKTRMDLDLSKIYNKLLVFLYSFSFLGFINFTLENVWLTSFYLKYTYFNDGWLNQIYFNEPSGWIVNYLRNFVYMTVFFIVSYDIINHVKANKKTVIGYVALSLYIILFFFLSPHYGYIDWTYAIMNNYSDSVILRGFAISVCGKPLLFYIFYSIFIPKKKRTKATGFFSNSLDVGCGSRPKGNVNVDLLLEDSDPLKRNLLQKKNFVVNNDKIQNFIRADARYLPFQDKVFDKSYCFHLMEHISEERIVYEEINRVSSREIEIRVPFGIWEDLFNIIFWYKHLASWRKKHHLRSYSKKMFNRSLLNTFDKRNVSVSYGFLSFMKCIRFELQRETRFPFPFPFELVATINLRGVE